METAISTLSVLPSTKEELAHFSQKLLSEIKSGMINPLQMKHAFKMMEKLTEAVKETLDPLAREEAEKYGNKPFEFQGMKIELAENGTKYHYDKCNDTLYEKLLIDFNTATKKLKARETFLKNLTEAYHHVDEDSGELVTIYPAYKTSTPGIKCELL